MNSTQNSPTKPKALPLLLLLLLCAAPLLAACDQLGFGASSPTPPPAPTPTPTAQIVEVEDLAQAYVLDPQQAKECYEGKRLTFHGNSISAPREETVDVYHYIVLELSGYIGEDSFTNVFCYINIDVEDHGASLEAKQCTPGASITFTGRCKGFVDGSITLMECSNIERD